LSDLCQQYWHPLYAYARRRGDSIEDAKDHTQSFMAHMVVTNFFQTAQPNKGRLRSLLLKSLQNHLINDNRKRTAAKRGGENQPLAIDAVSAEEWLAMEPSDKVTPELEYDRQWAREILRQAKADLQAAYAAAGTSAQF